jgi:hypothetical protein
MSQLPMLVFEPLHSVATTRHLGLLAWRGGELGNSGAPVPLEVPVQCGAILGPMPPLRR